MGRQLRTGGGNIRIHMYLYGIFAEVGYEVGLKVKIEVRWSPVGADSGI